MNKYLVDEEIFADILVQKEPMRFIDGVISYENNKGVAEFLVGGRACIGLDENGNLPVLCLMEVMAQSISGCLAYNAYINKEIMRIGLLLSTRSFKINVKNVIPKGTLLTTTIDVIYESEDGFSQVKVEVSDDQKNEICSAIITVFSPNNEKVKELFGCEI
ncbi:MAG: hypothetical protein ACI4V7_00345 [Succinivibrionaceae bacterium]